MWQGQLPSCWVFSCFIGILAVLGLRVRIHHSSFSTPQVALSILQNHYALKEKVQCQRNKKTIKVLYFIFLRIKPHCPSTTSPLQFWGWCICCCSLRIWQFVHHPFENNTFRPEAFCGCGVWLVVSYFLRWTKEPSRKPKFWEIKSSYRYRLEGLFSMFFSGPPLSVWFSWKRKTSKIIRTGDFSSTNIFGGPGTGTRIYLPC